MLLKARETFENTPSNLPDIAFQYFDITFGRRQLSLENAQKQLKSNPISIEGRKLIIDGCLNSINLIQKIQSVKIPIVIVHSLQNNIVDVNHTYLFENTFESAKLKQETEKLSIQEFFNSQRRRLTLLCEGGYSLFDERGPDFLAHLESFMTATLSHNNTLNMIFVEKVLNELEDGLLLLQEREIEDCKEIIQELHTFGTLQRDKQQKLYKKASSLASTFNAKIKDTQMKIEKSIENFKNVKIRMTKYELNEELNEMILQSEERRLMDIQTHLENVIKIDLNPLNKLLQLARIQIKLDENLTAIETVIIDKDFEKLHDKVKQTLQAEHFELHEIEESAALRQNYLKLLRDVLTANRDALAEIQEIRNIGFSEIEETFNWMHAMFSNFNELTRNLLKLELKLSEILHEIINALGQLEPEKMKAKAETAFKIQFQEIASLSEVLKLSEQTKEMARIEELAKVGVEIEMNKDLASEDVKNVCSQFIKRIDTFLANNELDESKLFSKAASIELTFLCLGAKTTLQSLMTNCKELRV